MAMSEWTSTYRNSLPDRSFLVVYTDKNGTKHRKLPVFDHEGMMSLAHINNAMSRLNQVTGITEQKRRMVGRQLRELQYHYKALHGHKQDREPNPPHDDAWIERGKITFEDLRTGKVKEVPVKKIGEGMFAVAYVTRFKNNKTPTVLVAVNNEGHRIDWSKQALWELYNDGERNPYLPAVKQLGHTDTDTIYEMPLYKVPLKKTDGKPWDQYKALYSCWDTASRKMVADGKKAMMTKGYGLRQMNEIIACAEGLSRKLIPRTLVKALEMLRDAMKDYGDDYAFEFAPKNLGTNNKGQLILLDATFSLVSMQTTRDVWDAEDR
jgi:hypothetical protein